jgi:ribosome-associated protein
MMKMNKNKGGEKMSFTTKEIAHKIAAAACDKKAKDILLLNMENISPVTDYFIIASAGNNILVKAIADNIEDKLAEAGIFVTHKEGYAEGRWILMDYGNCVAHIFIEEEREFYNLEQLWADAPSEEFVESKND